MNKTEIKIDYFSGTYNNEDIDNLEFIKIKSKKAEKTLSKDYSICPIYQGLLIIKI